ncbi:flagellar basal-body rod protein FlgG [Thermanaeromonas toyohensis ToBE]|uniref:Flagellar basal-body rod protein FlgG n=1 Tax=Thermanaeromonas toyohensis ToBE TaxID=698762 RepID=A0A1W1VMD0_9FIRM|nr:flagellar hook-basal body protein [Thermanaeromonas toyohensis]SMB94104.1 flagellar basal-body rod protein FlgG [Thermanaeromonas toyohensis ToBE]
MMRGLYLAATGMVVQQLRQETISHNLANATTTGYKAAYATQRSFPEVLLLRLEGQYSQGAVGTFSPGVMVDAVEVDFSPGPLEETGRSTDLALVDRPGQPPSFFAVQVGGEIRYTRNGYFRVGPTGYLETTEGSPVLGQSGPLRVGEGRWWVDTQGRVWVEDREIDRLLLVNFEQPQALQRLENNLFMAPPEAVPQEAVGVEVKQGFLEKPNLDGVREIIDMLSALRAYEAGQKVIQVQDELLGKVVNELGTVR